MINKDEIIRELRKENNRLTHKCCHQERELERIKIEQGRGYAGNHLSRQPNSTVEEFHPDINGATARCKFSIKNESDKTREDITENT